MGSIGQRIHLKKRESGNKKIYPWMDITNEKSQNPAHRWAPLRGNKMDGVIEKNESYPSTVSDPGQTKLPNFLTMESGWYRCRSL